MVIAVCMDSGEDYGTISRAIKSCGEQKNGGKEWVISDRPEHIIGKM